MVRLDLNFLDVLDESIGVRDACCRFEETEFVLLYESTSKGVGVGVEQSAHLELQGEVEREVVVLGSRGRHNGRRERARRGDGLITPRAFGCATTSSARGPRHPFSEQKPL